MTNAATALPKAGVSPRVRMLVSIISVCCLLGGAARAQGGTATGTGTKAPVIASSPVRGGVKLNAVQTEIGLKDMGEAIKRLRRAAVDMIGEVERQDMVTVAEPDVIGPIVLPAIPDVSGMLSTGTILPPRKKWIDIEMNEIGTLTSWIRDYERAVYFPADKKAQVDPFWQQIRALSRDIDQHYQNLKPLTVGPAYDNLAIGRQVLAIYDDTTKMNGPWKDIYKVVRK